MDKVLVRYEDSLLQKVSKLSGVPCWRLHDAAVKLARTQPPEVREKLFHEWKTFYRIKEVD